MDDNKLPMWVVTKKPSDLPQYKYVARKNLIGVGVIIKTDKYLTGDSLEAVRQLMRNKGLTVLPRDEHDDPVIVETWV